MELMIYIAIIAFVASLIISFIRSIFYKQIIFAAILVVIYIILLGLRYVLGAILSLETYGIIVAFIVRFMDYFWLVYIAPYFALIYSVFKGGR